MTATEASRACSALLDAIEAGETVTIERGGRRVAVVSPATTANGRQVRRLLARSVDDEFAADLGGIREGVDEADGAWVDA